MELSELVQFDEERCKRERPLLYLATYFGKDIEDREKEDFWCEKKEKPMRFIVGKLNAVYDLRGKFEFHLPPKNLEYDFSPPLLTLDFQKGRRRVCWENIACIDAVYA